MAVRTRSILLALSFAALRAMAGSRPALTSTSEPEIAAEYREAWEKPVSAEELCREIDPKTLAEWWQIAGPPTLDEARKHEAFGLPKSLSAGDVDGDGKAEVLCGTDEGWLLVFDASGTLLGKHNVKEHWDGWVMSELDGISCLAVADVDGDEKAEIIASVNDWLKVFDEDAGVQWQYRAAARCILAGDLDGDNVVEVITCGPTGLRVFDGRLGKLKWGSKLDGEGLAVGDLGLDRSLEIVVSTRSYLCIFSKHGRLLRMMDAGVGKGMGWSPNIAIADIVKDGCPEIIAGNDSWARDIRDDRKLWVEVLRDTEPVFDIWTRRGGKKPLIAVGDRDVAIYGNGKGPITKLPAGWQVKTVAFCQLDPGAEPELVCGGDNCFVYASRLSGELLWRYYAGYNVLRLVAGDLDGDGAVEVVAASDTLTFLDAKGSAKSQFLLSGPPRSWNEYDSAMRETARSNALEEDLDGDGQAETIRASGIVAVYKHDGGLLWARDVPYVWTMKVADLDADGSTEIVLGCCDGFVIVLDAEGRLEWHQPTGGEQNDIALVPSATGKTLDVVVKPLGHTSSKRFDAGGRLVQEQGAGHR